MKPEPAKGYGNALFDRNNPEFKSIEDKLEQGFTEMSDSPYNYYLQNTGVSERGGKVIYVISVDEATEIALRITNEAVKDAKAEEREVLDLLECIKNNATVTLDENHPDAHYECYLSVKIIDKLYEAIKGAK